MSPVSDIEQYKILVSSYLTKRSKTHQWKKRWVVLRNCQISYYKDKSEHKAIKVFSNADILSVSEIEDAAHKYRFSLYTSKKTIHLRAESEAERKNWIKKIQKVILNNASETKESALPVPISKSENGSRVQPRQVSETEFSGADDFYLSSGVSDSSLPAAEYKPPQAISEKNDEEGSSEDHEEFIHDGTILRLRKRYNQWKQIYLILTNTTMSMYKNNHAEYPYKKINVKDIVDAIEIDPVSSTKKWCILVITPKKRITFCCESEDDLTQWLASFKTLIERKEREAKQ